MNTNSPIPLVIYHRADFDGLFCHAIARLHYGAAAEYLGWHYGDPVPEVAPGRRIVMLDISVKELMAWPDLVWIDHHVSAMQRWPSVSIPGLRIDGVAACRLAWQWYFGTACNPRDSYIDRIVREPQAVRLAGEYDVWDKRDPRAEVFQHGLRSRRIDVQHWNLLLHPGLRGDALVDELLKDGRAVQYAQARHDESVITNNGFTLEWQGFRWLALNTVRCNSLAFAAGLQPEHDGCLAFGYDGKFGRWKISLYGVPGKPSLDFSPIAVKHGGGGHRQACGFTSTELPFCPGPI